ncbi:MAG: murein biosynthesis integral membrane protein MurJ [Candidatus Omnitrophica bacterium]|nr:murein biosynthesis integral membrane protein MurJ [Candidatus Omnitrophota bacterium]
MSINKSIIKSSYVISAGTVFSRILGFFRDIVIAGLLGTTPGAEAFVAAFRIPNLFRDLVGEGAVNSAVVPVFSEYIVKKDKDDFLILANIVFYSSLSILTIITALGIIFSPLIVRLIAPGFLREPSTFSLTVNLTRLMFPYLVFIGLTAYGTGILFSHKSFFAPSFSPALLNISLIVSALFASYFFKEPVYGLAIGVLVGGILQLAFQIPYLHKNGFSFIKITTLAHPGAKAILRLLMPRVFGTAVYQLNIFADTICASLAFIVGQGSIAAIYYANRIIQFPLAVFGLAIASAALPTMSRLAAEQNLDELRNTVSFSLRSIFLIMMPCSVALMVLAGPIIRLLFQRGQFTPYSTVITSSALLFYALGLFAFAGVKISVSCFYSLKDTKTPVKVAACCLILNVLLNIILMFPLKVAGLALASSISAVVNFCVLSYILQRRIGRYIQENFVYYFAKLAFVSLIMGVAIYLLWFRFLVFFNMPLRFITVILSGIVVFVLGCIAFKIKEIKDLIGWFLKKQ